MKSIFLYKKWSLLILLNNLIISGFLSYQKKLIFLQFDTTNFFFWVYEKRKIEGNKIVDLKNQCVLI